MSFLAQKKTKRLLAIHGWSGLSLGVLLYTIVLTGAVAVFAQEIGVWSVGGAKNQAGLTQPVDAIIRKFAEDVPEEYREDVGVSVTADGKLAAFFHTHAMRDGEVDEKGVRFLADPATGEVLQRREGWSEEVFAGQQTSALREFLVDLHVQLYVPAPWGLILTGILGLAMMAAAVSGILMHKHILKDIFVAPRQGKLLDARDRHILAGSWGLPFAFLLAFTGSFLSFAFSIGMPVVGMSAFGGDQMAIARAIGGEAGEEDKTPAAVTDIDAVVKDGAARADSKPTFLHIGHYGRADSSIGIYFAPPEGDLSYLQYTYDGATGAFTGPKPGLGSGPSAGASTYTILSALHYGYFAGVVSKLVWLALGFASCYVIVTGMNMWFARRREEASWARWEKIVPVIGYGLPLAMLGSGHAFFAALGRADTTYWTPLAFLAVALAAIALGLAVRERRALSLILLWATVAAAALLPPVRMLTGGSGWIEAIGMGAPIVVSIDLALLAAALFLVLANAGLRWPFSAREGKQRRAGLEPAE